jgi:glycosyltransferase involved in cell wall biosynthesis
MGLGIENQVSLVCPVYNAADVLPAAIASWRAQTVYLGELIVVDDGSTDSSASVAQELGVRVIRFEENRGRGAARAEATLAASGEYLLFADAHNSLAPDFVEKAVRQFEVPAVVGVVGCWYDPEPQGVFNRWRARHLYRSERGLRRPNEVKSLSTHACLLRRSAVMAAGNFNLSYRANEDAELAGRMAATGGRFIHSEDCRVRPLKSNRWGELVERHTRWYIGANEQISFRWYVKWLVYAVKVMVVRDWRAGDPLASALSLWLPQAMARQLMRRRTS